MKIKISKTEKRLIGVLVSFFVGLSFAAFTWWLSGCELLPNRGGDAIFLFLWCIIFSVFSAAFLPFLIGSFVRYIKGEKLELY